MTKIFISIFAGYLALSLSADGLKKEKGEHLVFLSAVFTIKNDGNQRLDPYNLSLTYPALSMPSQRLVGILYPFTEKYQIRTHSRNNLDQYLVFPLKIEPYQSVKRKVTFQLALKEFSFSKEKFSSSTSEDVSFFLKPYADIESDAHEIKEISKTLKAEYKTDRERLYAAYLFTQKRLKYRRMKGAKGALWALRNKIGDCTEYAALFVALARAMQIPARMTSEFNFKNSHRFSVPNHNAAEVYLEGRWIPVDPNLGLVPKLRYGFGTSAVNKIVLKRHEAWVWSRPASVKGVSKAYLKEKVSATLKWEITQED